MMQFQEPGERPRFRRSSTMKIGQDRTGFLKKFRQKAENLSNTRKLSVLNIPCMKVHLDNIYEMIQPSGDD
jgi:hypothetical protein